MDVHVGFGGRPPALRRLHGAQAVATFSQVVRPPWARGRTWSKVSSLRRAAIDAAEFVAQEQVESRERRIFVGPDIIAEARSQRAA